MTFSRATPAGKSDGQTLTAAEYNALDIDHAASVDCATLTVATSGSPATVTRTAAGMPFMFNDTDGSPSTTGWKASAPASYATTTTGATVAIYFPVDVPLGCTITAVACWVKGAAHAALPATMPALSLFKQSVSGTPSTLVSVNDASATTGTYCVAHAVGTAGLTEVANTSGFVYRIGVYNEAGANSVSGLTVYSPYVTRTQTKLDY